MASGLFDPEGGADPTLSGVESRTLRALLQLERRHIAILADAAGEPATTTERVTQWERAKGRGYPPALVILLRDIESATAELAHELASGADASEAGRLTIVRPRSAEDIQAALDLAGTGVTLSPAHLTALIEGGGDFWERLADAATAAAATQLGHADGRDVHVVYATPPDA